MTERQLGVDHLTALALAPCEFIAAAGAAGFASVSLRTLHIFGGEPEWASEPVDAAELAATAVRAGVRVHAIEAIALSAELSLALATDPAVLRSELAVGEALGASFLYCFADDPDADRAAETFARVAALASGHGMIALLEPMPYRAVTTLPAASELVLRAGGGGLIVDALHATRGGTVPADLWKLPAAQLAVLQLCDAPASAPTEPAPSGLHPLMHEARHARRAPGAGALPLAAFAAAMPATAIVTVEAPIEGAAGEPAAQLAALYDATTHALASGRAA